MTIIVNASKVEVYPINGKHVSAELSDIDVCDIIDAIGIEKILEKIGKDAVVEHFNIIEIE